MTVDLEPYCYVSAKKPSESVTIRVDKKSGKREVFSPKELMNKFHFSTNDNKVCNPDLTWLEVL